MRAGPEVRRRTSRAVAALTCLGVLFGSAPPVPAAVVAAVPVGARADEGDDEGGTRAMREQLERAAKGYLDAETTLLDSQRRQVDLATRHQQLEAELAQRTGQLGELAATAYRSGRLSAVSVLLDADSPDGLLDRATMLRAAAADEDRQVRAVLATRDEVARAGVAINAEIEQQRKQVAVMATRKRQAEQALAEFGGQVSNGFHGTRPLLAEPAPRGPDGSLPGQSCAVDDPTTGGCITARTLHALRQAKAAGFPRFVSCFRGDGGPGEHPKGRACDFAVHPGRGFGGVATGGDRAYGDDLAAYLVRNARRLGVLYVIWYRQIWFPGGGWRHYTLGRGDPNTDHTNHVHLSMY